MRSGRLHVGGFSTGPTAFAVNLAGAVPFAVKGNEKEFQGYNLIVIVKKRQPLPEARGPQGQEGRAHRRRRRTPATWRRSRCSRREGLAPDKDYKITVLGQARPVGAWASAPATTTRRPSPPTSSTAWACAARSRKTISASSTAARNSRRRRSPTRTISSPKLGDKMLEVLLRLPFHARDAKGVRRRRPLLPDQVQEGLGSRAQGGRRARARRSTAPPTRRKRRARRRARKKAAEEKRRRSSR